MMLALFGLTAAILWIVIGTSWLKWPAFWVLLIAVLFMAWVIDTPVSEIPSLIAQGFGQTFSQIGLLILFGSIIGVILEKSGATLSIARFLIHQFSAKYPLLVMNLLGFLVAIPVFCDAAFVVLSSLNRKLSATTGKSLTAFSVALATGLYATHVLVPPTPGPLAVAATFEMENIFLLFIFGIFFAMILSLIGWGFSAYLAKRPDFYETSANISPKQGDEIPENLPAVWASFSPILIPVFLMALGTIGPIFWGSNEWLSFIAHPTIALLAGVIAALFIQNAPKDALQHGIIQAAPILFITAMGGALGGVLKMVPFAELLQSISISPTLFLLIPFTIAASLKTAQGSSTVAMITTASMVFPLMATLGISSEADKIWVILATGMGAMTVSHANDSYFWIVSQLGQMDLKTAYKTHTLSTLFQGVVGILLLMAFYFMVH
jgi:GntP family gluconate:H+ symporter